MRANKDLFLAITRVSSDEHICGVKLDLTGIAFSEMVQTRGGRVASYADLLLAHQ